MSDIYDHGPLVSYEITWVSGHVETIQAHQVTWPGDSRGMFGVVDVKATERARFMGEINGRWVLVLEARVEDIRTIRNKVTESIVEVTE